MLALLAVLALILYACSGAGSAKKRPNGSGRTSATGATQSSVPTASGGSSPQASGGATATSGGTTNAPSSSGAPSGSLGASGSTGGTGGATGSAGGVSGGTGGTGGNTGGTTGGASGGTTGGASGGTTGGTGGTGGTAGGPGGAGGLPASNGSGSGCQLSLTLTSQSPAYVNGDQPAFTVSVLNKGNADCVVDLGPKSLMLNIYSGSDRIWSSADCTTGGADLRGISPGDVQTVTYTWNRVRSAPGCPAGGQTAKLGMYFGVVTLPAGNTAAAPGAQSQPKTFELKSGS